MPQRATHTADASAESHLEGFVRSFIAPSFQPRWRHLLLDEPAKAQGDLHKFEHHRHKSRSRSISHHAWVALLQGELAEVRGCYFDGQDPPAVLSGAEVLARLSPYPDDAIWSIIPQVEAYFFHHEGEGWACRMP